MPSNRHAKTAYGLVLLHGTPIMTTVESLNKRLHTVVVLIDDAARACYVGVLLLYCCT